MQAIVQPSSISGAITASASKSAMQRALAAALIKKGKTILKNPGISADDLAALGIIQQLGAKVEKNNNAITISSEGIQPIGDTINCGESGLSVRMFTPIASVSDHKIFITGSGSLLKRPLSVFNEILPGLGVKISSAHGLLPLEIQGPLVPSDIELDGSLSSQFLTGILFAFAAADASDVSIRVQNLNSKPYIDLTLQVMDDFGLKAPVNNNYTEFYFGKQSTAMFPNKEIRYTVEADWSGAAFLLVAGAIAGNVTVKGLNIFSTQADKRILQALMQCEALVSITEEQIRISKNNLKAFHFDATDCPDLFPPLVALAAYCEGSSVIEGVQRLIHKESNRSLSLQEEFQKMGVPVEVQNNLMLVKGGSVKGTTVSSHHDHRIAMACAVAALGAEGEMVIKDAESVNKSYPQFWEHLQKLNVRLSLNQDLHS